MLNRVNAVDVATDVVECSSGVGTISVAPLPVGLSRHLSWP